MTKYTNLHKKTLKKTCCVSACLSKFACSSGQKCVKLLEQDYLETYLEQEPVEKSAEEIHTGSLYKPKSDSRNYLLVP